MSVCPNCGYCPCCGRPHYQPSYQPYYTPYWGIPSYTNGGGTINSGVYTSGGLNGTNSDLQAQCGTTANVQGL